MNKKYKIITIIAAILLVSVIVYAIPYNKFGDVDITGNLNMINGGIMSGNGSGITDVSVEAKNVQNFDIAGSTTSYYANNVNMSDESITYVNGSTVFIDLRPSLDIIPLTDDSISVGNTSHRVQEVHVSDNVTIGNVVISDNGTFGTMRYVS